MDGGGEHLNVRHGRELKLKVKKSVKAVTHPKIKIKSCSSKLK